MITRHRLLLFSIVLLALAVIPPVSARQGAQATPIQIGQTVNGQVVDTQNPALFSFQGAAGEPITVQVSGQGILVYVVIADTNFTKLAESDTNGVSNAAVQTTLPSKGLYYIGVFGSQAGAFTLSLGTGTGVPAAQASPQPANVQTGQVDNTNAFVQFPLTGVPQGDTIVVDVQATSGDLDTYLYLIYGAQISQANVVAENDDIEQGNTNSHIEYPNAQAGDYTIIVSRYDGQNGQTSGTFQLTANVTAATSTLPTVNVQATPNPAASGYPADNPHPMADWTILAYIGGDNNLEAGAINDFNEFELAGGSTPSVRVVALLDRSPENDTSNGDWNGARIFEVGPDRTGDTNNWPPTMDSPPLADLGNINSAYGGNLSDFLVWGIKNYPARHYAVELNDHGGAWSGIITDDSAGSGNILTIPALSQAFATALQAAGLQKFDLLINDACLMSSVDYFSAVDSYFHYAISSPEIQVTPGFDMTLLTQELNASPNMDMGQLGTDMVNKYLADMQQMGTSDLPYLTGSVVNLDQFSAVTDAVNNFTTVVDGSPALYAPLIGSARSNVYIYSPFEPEDQAGPHDKIDLGDFMKKVVSLAGGDQVLASAAQNVETALKKVLIYGTAGSQAAPVISYFNIYFPASSDIFDQSYQDNSPLRDWAEMLRDYYANSSGASTVASDQTQAFGVAPPQVAITNVYPSPSTSIVTPTIVSMEVTGKNIAQGDFTVDQLQPDGSAIRLETSRILTRVETTPGYVEYINEWNPGVDDSDFTWPVTISVLTDGQTTNPEWISFSEQGLASVGGRYHDPGSSTWQDIYIIFDDNGNSSRVISQQNGLTANIQLKPGGEFQTYKAVVTPDGQVDLQPGNTYQWTANGISWHDIPAPTGNYNLGFLVRSFGGATGFGSTKVKVNDDGVDATKSGYTDIDWGFNFLRPADWGRVFYFPSQNFLQTGASDNSQYMFVYPVDVSDPSDPNLLKTIAQNALSPFSIDVQGPFTVITAGGQQAAQFDFSYSNTAGAWQGRAFAVYVSSLQLGLVFSAESLNGQNLDANYQLLLSSVSFFDATAVKARDTGVWTTDSISAETTYPVRNDWMDGVDVDIWHSYSPGANAQSPTFIRYTQQAGTDAPTILNNMLQQYAPTNASNFEIRGSGAYRGGQNLWQQALYVYDGANGQRMVGMMNVTIKNNTAYVVWFETDGASFEQTYTDVFTPMLDGLQITDTSATATPSS